jgi:hypothetical protein
VYRTADISRYECGRPETAFGHGRFDGMPRFFFHLYDDEVTLDPEGRELPNAAAAKDEAIKNAREIACAEVVNGHLGLNHRIEVTDANDTPVVTITFRDVVKLHP